MADTLYVRDLGEAENQALDWYKEKFAVGTASGASREMISKFPKLHEDYQKLRQDYALLSNHMDLLRRLAREKRELDQRIDDLLK